MKWKLVTGITVSILLIAIIAVTMSESMASNNSANSALMKFDANKYTIENLSHMTESDFATYVAVKHSNPLTDMLDSMRKQGMDNATIEKNFGANGITYSSAKQVFVFNGGQEVTKDRASHYIEPSNPFISQPNVSTSDGQSLTPLTMAAASNDPIQNNMQLTTYMALYQGIKVTEKTGTMTTNSNVPHRVYPIHMGIPSLSSWMEIGIVASQLNGPRTVEFYVYAAGNSWASEQPVWYTWNTAGLGDVSSEGLNTFKLFLWQDPGTNTIWCITSVNGHLLLGKPGYPGLNSQCDNTQEAWTWNNNWDCHDTVWEISQDMYLYQPNSATVYDDPNGWFKWNNNGNAHWSPYIGNAFGNQFGMWDGSYWMKSGLR